MAMPAFLVGFVGMLVQAAGSIAGHALLSLGMGFIVFNGVDASLNWVSVQVATRMTGLPALTVDALATLKLGSCVSIILSALAARLTFDGMKNGVMKRFGPK